MKHIICEISNQIATLWINRPQVLNALNRDVLEELLEFLKVTALQQQLKAVILTGSGEKSFIAGADIKEMNDLNPLEMLEFCQLGQRVSNALETGPYLTLAAVNGYALGGGMEMALGCDFIYGSKSARLGLPEVNLGIIPGFGGTQRLARLIGVPLAKELVMSGRILNAQEAYDLHIINRLCEPDSLLIQSRATVTEILKNPFFAVLQAKRAINCSMEPGLGHGLETERNMCAECFASSERVAAMAAFLEKRKATHEAR